MEDLRTQGCCGNPEIVDTKAPFSNFSFIETRFPSCTPLKRILSQMRQLNYETMVIEPVESVGFSKEDDQDLEDAGLALSSKNLFRLSFFKNTIEKKEDILKQTKEGYLGYAILKEVPCNDSFRWIIFESITKTSRHDNNFYHARKIYKIKCVDKAFEIKGNLYCQQNGTTNVCAHVALRTALSMLESYEDFSCREINKILDKIGCPHQAGEGLSLIQISKLLKYLEINYNIVEYHQNKKELNIPFYKYVYGSVEIGYPALLGFSLKQEENTSENNVGHIIPAIGHTFNEDTWIPNAEKSYFTIGKDIRYVPSESWVSSYIYHDDNFGSHYCLPRQYMEAENDVFVISLLPQHTKFDSTEAEVFSINHLFSIASGILDPVSNIWIKRFKEAIVYQGGWVVLRPVYLTGLEYLEHLEALEGWEKEKIDPILIKGLEGISDFHLWMIEVSLPELFPANKRKLGEVILNAEKDIRSEDLLIFTRLPGFLYVLSKLVKTEKPVFSKYETNIKTHTQIYTDSK